MGLIILFVIGLLCMQQTPEPITTEQIEEAEAIIVSIIPQEEDVVELEVSTVPEVEKSEEKVENSKQARTQQDESTVDASSSNTSVSHAFVEMPSSDSPNFVSYKYSFIGDFEDAYLGYCAKDVPDGMWSEDLQPSVALGIKSIMDTTTYHSMKGKMASLFNAYVWEGGRMSSGLGNVYIFGPVEWFGIKTGYEDQLFKPSVSFVITWSTRTISITEPGGDLPAYSIEEAQQWATEATAYLRWLDSAYKAKCGNYTSLY